MAFWAAAAPALIQGATSLLGGLFGRKSAKKEAARARAAAREDFLWEATEGLKAKVQGAEAAGINPVTLLGGTGGSQILHAPVLASADSIRSTGEIVSDAVSTGVNTFMAAYQSPHEREMQDLEKAIAYKRLEALSDPTARSSLMGPVVTRGAPVTAGTTFSNGAPTRPRNMPRLSRVDPNTAQFDAGNPTVTNPFPASTKLRIDESVPDASVMAERWGEDELTEFATGTYVKLKDGIRVYKDWLGTDTPARDWWSQPEVKPRLRSRRGRLEPARRFNRAAFQ